MLSGIYNMQNRVLEKQKLVQRQAHVPVYYRLPRSKLYVNSYLVLFSAGMACTTLGVYQLIRGKPSE